MGVADDLAKYHAVDLHPQQLADYAWLFASQRELSEKILDRWKFTNSPMSRFPSIHQLINLATDIRAEEAKEAKAREPVFGDLKRSAKSLHATKSIEMILAMLEGKTNHKEYLAQMRRMDIEFPGMGWAAEAFKLEQFWEEQFAVIGEA